MNVGNEEREDYEDEMFSKGGTIAEIELPEVDFGPPIPLSAPLNQLLKGQLHEYSSLKDTLKHAEEIVRKRKLEREEKKKKEDAELLLRNPEYTLKTLHQIIRNPDVVQYLENIGDIIVFELERGMGKNIILFSKIDLTPYRNKIEQLESQKPYIENSRRTPRDKKKNLDLIKRGIHETTEEMKHISKWGGNIFLYSDMDDQYHHLDFYSSDRAKANRSLSLLQVYFGKNRQFEDSFHKFNTPEKVMDLIIKNIRKYGDKEFVKLRNKIQETEQQG